MTRCAGFDSDLVSVIIPCYNQGRYLAQAVGSVLCQSYRPVEVVVVNDGSREDLQAIADSPTVRHVWQPHAGVSAARNAGFRQSAGSYVVFLDSDDRLTPNAVADGLQAFAGDREAAAAIGLCRMIGEDGDPRPFEQRGNLGDDLYLELLRNNFVWMPAQVLYRREVLATGGPFDSRVNACADYDLYLRIARARRLVVHDKVVADYRTHGQNMSADAALMLRSVLGVLDRQSPFVAGHAERRRAQAEGKRFWRRYYGDGVVDDIRAAWRTAGGRRRALRAGLTLLCCDPGCAARHLLRKLSLTSGWSPTRG